MFIKRSIKCHITDYQLDKQLWSLQTPHAVKFLVGAMDEDFDQYKSALFDAGLRAPGKVNTDTFGFGSDVTKVAGTGLKS